LVSPVDPGQRRNAKSLERDVAVVAVGLGQRGQTGYVDLAPGVKSITGPCGKGK